jgi:regulator of sigma E protease
MAQIIHRYPGKEVDVVFAREGGVRSFRIVPKLDTPSGRGLIGIMPEVRYKRLGLLLSVKEGARQCWYWTSYTIQTLLEKLIRRERPDLAGPVGIVQMVSRAAHSGIEDFIFLIGLISVAIGFFNLLPIPLLDGGHAVLYLWEGLSRRKLTLKVIAYVNSFGLVFLLSVLLFATYNDIIRIRDQRRAKKEAKAAAEETSPQGAPQPVVAK